MESLPDELLDLIVFEAGTLGLHYLHLRSPIYCVETLFNISLVSRRLCRIAESHLYRNIRVDLSEPYTFNFPNKPLIYRSSTRLLRRIDTQKDVAQGVTALTVENSLSERPVHERYYKADELRLHDLLRKLPNIKYLDALYYASSKYLLNSLNPRSPNAGLPTTTAQVFANVSYLAFDIGDSELADLHPVFRLPQVTTLEFRNGRTSELNPERARPWMRLAALPTIKNLIFIELRLSFHPTPDDLRIIGKICMSLERLKIRCFDEGIGTEEVLYAFRSCLALTLQSLEVIGPYSGNPWYADSLSVCPVLEHIWIELEPFLFQDSDLPRNLPRSVKFLRLHTVGYDVEGLTNGLWNLEKDLPTRFPYLCTLILDIDKRNFEDPKYQWRDQEFETEFAKVGVNFHIYS